MPTSTSEFAAINQTAAFSQRPVRKGAPERGGAPKRALRPPSSFTYSPKESGSVIYSGRDVYASRIPYDSGCAPGRGPIWLGGGASARGPHLDDFSSFRTYRNFADRRRNTPACRYFRFLQDDGCSRYLKGDFFVFFFICFSFLDMRWLKVSNLDV